MTKQNIRYIKLQNAKKVFPYKYTKVRPHDLVNITVDKKELLNKREKKALVNTASDMRAGKLGDDWDFMAIRIGKKIKVVGE